MLFIKTVNLAIRFLLELCVLAALGYGGFHFGAGSLITKLALGIGSPLLIAILWGTFIAPKATLLLPEPYRFILECLIFGAASSALYLVGETNLAMILGVLFLINRIQLSIWKQ
ncbi:YrdB family protein [Paenibacillus cremeus]|uniref:DUF2568 domain-containing protein n=1 Tax=Paenibacillus cremeus TaxID=2163881 RepID=A0A559JSS6_9BACL|nr:YrdB family protein [Paenibacillus cremeus]TVY02921.1 DUF2568 domain-containing protein [Paenibacillus cremeus]